MSEWISVEDRLPENGRGVLCTDGELMLVMHLTAYGFAPSNVTVTYDMASVIEELDAITHWMPLPEPPND